MSAIDMPACPECGNDLSMEFGNVDLSSDGLVHHFDCEHCGNHEAWDMQEMSDRGVERPSLSDFIAHYDLTLDDLREKADRETIVTFLRSFDGLSDARDKLGADDDADDNEGSSE